VNEREPERREVTALCFLFQPVQDCQRCFALVRNRIGDGKVWVVLQRSAGVLDRSLARRNRFCEASLPAQRPAFLIVQDPEFWSELLGGASVVRASSSSSGWRSV